MTSDQIRTFLSLGEGHNIEFKTTARHKEGLGKEICGFLNASGGYLICGVDERGPVPGVDISAAALSKLEAYLHDKISPKALVEMQSMELEGKPVLVFEVPKGHDVPYAFDGAIYVRSGDRTEKANAETIRDIIMRREIEPERWERRFSMGDLEVDTDLDEVREAVTDAEKVRRAFFRNAKDPFAVLEDFSAAKYGRLTNGGDVLFGKNPARRIPQARVRAMAYASDKAGDSFPDMKSFEGPLHSVFQKTYAFIVRNTSSPSRFVKGDPKRQDTPIFPEAAIREALINAFAHRDYTASSGGVAVHIYPKRLEIWNSGPLPKGVAVERLAKGELSVLRNPDIAHVLYLRGLMEKAGRGCVLMVKQCREHGLPDPQWTSDEARGVTVTFFAPKVVRQGTSASDTQLGTDDVPSLSQVCPKSIPSGLARAVLGSAQPTAEIQALMTTAGHTNRTRFRTEILKPLMEAGLLEMTIPDKPRSSKQEYRHTPLGRNWLNEGGAT